MISTPVNLSAVNMRTGLIQTSWFFLCFMFLVWSQAVFTSEASAIPPVADDAEEAWLITFGPGELYFERFGHNAIWLREPTKGLDHTFNFGYFDFQQENFFLRFMRGRMLYFSVAQPATKEFEYYQHVNRSIRAQKLNLTRTQYQRLRDHLLNEVQPENRNYRYDYYLNNCSTRIRDALDIALDGALSAKTGQIPASLNFRDHTRRLTQMQFWYYLGLEAGLGLPVDRAVTRWDEMFIPLVVADVVASIEATGKPEPLVEVDTMIFTSTLAVPDTAPASIWYRYLLVGLLISGLAWLSGKFMPPVWVNGLCRAWILVSVTMGMVLAALWFLTDHAASGNNVNLLLLNPLLLLALVPRLQRLAAMLLITGNVVALLLLMMPLHQYNLDLIAMLSPINIAVAIYLLRPLSRKNHLQNP